MVRKILYPADWLVVFCMTFFLCAAPIAAVHAEGAEGGQGTAPVVKKKIALVQFDVANTQHVDDINNVYDGLPLALASRLEASGGFLTTYTGRSIPAEAGEAQRADITQIAEEAGAQFLIYGTVVNAGTKQEKGFLGTSIGGSTKRHIEVEFSVYDGLTGARLLQRRLDEQAQGEVRVGNNKPFGSSIFFETELGQALNRLLDLAVKDIRATLEDVPFSAHVIRAEAKKVFLDAGSDALLKPGDRLVVYVRDAAPVVGLKGSVLGVTDRAADTATLTQVQPQFSIGELSDEAAKLGIKAGSTARIDPIVQRSLDEKQMEARKVARAQQEAKVEAEQVKAEQAAQAKAARAKAEQAAKDEAARIKAEKKAAAQAKAQAAAEAKAAKLKARQEARAARIKAEREARAREQSREKVRAAAEAKAAKLKAQQEAKQEAEAEAACRKAQTVCLKAEQKAQAEAEAKPAAESIKPVTEPKLAAEPKPAKQEPRAAAAPESAKAKMTPKAQAGTEVRAVAIEDLQRAAAEAEAAKADAASSVPPEQKKPGVSLKLKQIKP
jgi:hypothetical protein